MKWQLSCYVPLQLKFFDRSSGFEKVRGEKRRSEGENNSNYIWYWQTLWLVIAEKQTGKISCQPLPVYPSPIKWAADSICVHLCVCLRVQKSLYLNECSSFNDNVHTKIHLLLMQQENLSKLLGFYKWHINERKKNWKVYSKTTKKNSNHVCTVCLM